MPQACLARGSCGAFAHSSMLPAQDYDPECVTRTEALQLIFVTISMGLVTSVGVVVMRTYGLDSIFGLDQDDATLALSISAAEFLAVALFAGGLGAVLGQFASIGVASLFRLIRPRPPKKVKPPKAPKSHRPKSPKGMREKID